MDILFSVYMVGAITMLCFVLLMMVISPFTGVIPWGWLFKATLIAATWPIMLLWGIGNVIYVHVKMRK